ncbi:MAG: PAS domain-containing sensor histidine kinase [Rhodospirillaceae bacterium]|nr:PAS domain-containing sensor histidine kinase [Rhodospirillaceae bacterium]
MGQLMAWGRRSRVERWLAILLLVLAVGSGITTYLTVTGALGFLPNPRTVLVLLVLNLVILLGLGAIVIRRLVALWLERRRGLAGARLHSRLVLLFAVVAVTPAIIVAVFSAMFLNLGIEAWFSDRVRTAVKDSLIVARAYLAEHQQQIGSDVLSVLENLRNEGPLLEFNRERFERVLEAHVRIRGLDEAAVLDGQGRVIVSAGFSALLSFDPGLPDWAYARARLGDVVVLPGNTEDRVRALVQLDSLADDFLVIGRQIDPRVLQHLDATEGAAQLYEQLEGQREGLQITFVAVFFIVALLLLIASVWVALIVANQLARPIGRLFTAAEQIRAGDLSTRVPEGDSVDEIGSLSRAFNRMAAQLEDQRTALISTNKELDDRRRFTEAVLGGVSAGVIGLDSAGRINLPNRSAADLLGVDLDQHAGKPLGDVVPEMGELLAEAAERPRRVIEGQVSLLQQGQNRSLLVRIAGDIGAGELLGYVVTFDDVTDLMAAQRKAAWADVARRIAHEIKNPLTPIQLSAERLKRKYLKQITNDPETFIACTDTIVRQVGDIGRMVDEFSAFARMPAPVFQQNDLVNLARQALFLQREAHPRIAYHFQSPMPGIGVRCDARQIGQVLTNLLQNAADAIEGREPTEDQRVLPMGEVWLEFSIDEHAVAVIVSDNGKGLPTSGRERLTEPYVTTRMKGTGLGLAIVKKIMEDHGGRLHLGDRLEGGARITLFFPIETSGIADMESDSSNATRGIAVHGA